MKLSSTCVIVVDTKTKLLLGATRRDQPTVWGLPGGKLEEHETPIRGILREIVEETGLKLDPGKLHPIYEGPADDRIDQICIGYLYMVCGSTLKPQAMEKGIDISWITWSDLLKGAFPTYNKVIMETLQRDQFKNMVFGEAGVPPTIYERVFAPEMKESVYKKVFEPYPNIGAEVKIIVPRGKDFENDRIGIVESRNGEVIYVRVHKSQVLMEVYLSEIRLIEKRHTRNIDEKYL